MARVVSGRTFWVVIGVVILALFGYAMFVAGGGSAPEWLAFVSPATPDPLAASGPEEQVLRGMRLAGIDHALVGEQGGGVVLRLELPTVNSAPDIEIAWQSGIAAQAAAYPDANEYAVQVFLDSVPLLEVRAPGTTGRAAADGAALAREDLRFVYLTTASDLTATRPTSDQVPEAPSAESTPGPLGYLLRGITGDPWRQAVHVPPEFGAPARLLADSRPPGATPLPPAVVSVGLDLPAAYLDAKNRAAGFVRENRQLGDTATDLVTLAERSRSNAPGIPALPAGTDPVRFWSDLIGGLLANSRSGVDGGEDLLRALSDSASPESDTRKVTLVRAVAMTAMAVESDGFGENTAAFAQLAEEIAEVPLPQGGPAADAVLVAAFSPDAPQDAKEVVLFERAELFDRNPNDPQNSSMGDAIAIWYGADGPLGDPDGALSLSPDRWVAYRRGDGTYFWLAGATGSVALTDASVLGWAYDMPRAALVDAVDVGIARSYLEPAR